MSVFVENDDGVCPGHGSGQWGSDEKRCQYKAEHPAVPQILCLFLFHVCCFCTSQTVQNVK